MGRNQTEGQAVRIDRHHARESRGHVARGRRDANAGGLERLDLLGRGALAARDDGAGVAHALAGRRRGPRDEAGDRLVHLLLDEARGALLGAAADLADQDDAVGVRIGLEELEHVDEVHAADRIAADADARRLPDAARRELADRLVGERARARDDADVPGLVDVARHDADLAADAGAPGVMTPGQFGPDEARLALQALEHAPHLEHVGDRHALGDADDELEPRVERLEDRVGRARRRARR